MRIRTASALKIRAKVIAPPYGFWKLNRQGKYWTLHLTNPPSVVGSIPSYEPFWAMARNHQTTDFETYGSARGVIAWTVVSVRRLCHKCASPFEQEPHAQRMKIYCTKCVEKHPWLGLDNYRQFDSDVYTQAMRASRADVRWFRELIAQGHHTKAEFQALCEYYGGVCLCCGRNCPLVADHVVPLDKGGSNSIGNIQPLCRSCNSRKSTKSIDYRKAFPSGHTR